MRILLAEDDGTNRDILARLLVRLGAEVEATADGSEALAAFRRAAERDAAKRGEDPFDLVLLDLYMPAMDGMRAAKAMRDIEAGVGRSRVPILALTGADEDGALALAGFDGMVQKPVGLAGLKETLARWSVKEAP